MTNVPLPSSELVFLKKVDYIKDSKRITVLQNNN